MKTQQLKQLEQLEEQTLCAFCKSQKCGIPRDTCLSLGSCDDYDIFKHYIYEIYDNLKATLGR